MSPPRFSEAAGHEYAAMKYNADEGVNPDNWLSLYEAERTRLARKFNKSIGDDLVGSKYSSVL